MPFHLDLQPNQLQYCQHHVLKHRLAPYYPLPLVLTHRPAVREPQVGDTAAAFGLGWQASVGRPAKAKIFICSHSHVLTALVVWSDSLTRSETIITWKQETCRDTWQGETLPSHPYQSASLIVVSSDR